jgi:cytoplasmic iron level regulating protein YaaA (DUF328/UPF0246 family)
MASNEHKFVLNNEEYLLTWYNKPIVTKCGIEQIALPILTEYILKEKLPIQLVNSKGTKEVTYTLARKILALFSNGKKEKFRKINLNAKKSEIKSEHSQLNTNNSIKISDKSLFLVACCSNKILRKELKNKTFEIESLHFNQELGKHRNEIFELINNPLTTRFRKNSKGISKKISNTIDIDKSHLAGFVYSKGLFYGDQGCSSSEWSPTEMENIYIVSALFGIIRADDYIPLYDLSMNDTVNGQIKFAQKFWEGKLDQILNKLFENGYQIINLLGNDYSNCFDRQNSSKMINPNLLCKGVDCLRIRGKWLKTSISKKMK